MTVVPFVISSSNDNRLDSNSKENTHTYADYTHLLTMCQWHFSCLQ